MHQARGTDLVLVLDAVETAASLETVVHGEDTDQLILLLNPTTSDLKPISLKPHQRRERKNNPRYGQFKKHRVSYVQSCAPDFHFAIV